MSFRWPFAIDMLSHGSAFLTYPCDCFRECLRITAGTVRNAAASRKLQFVLQPCVAVERDLPRHTLHPTHTPLPPET